MNYTGTLLLWPFILWREMISMFLHSAGYFHFLPLYLFNWIVQKEGKATSCFQSYFPLSWGRTWKKDSPPPRLTPRKGGKKKKEEREKEAVLILWFLFLFTFLKDLEKCSAGWSDDWEPWSSGTTTGQRETGIFRLELTAAIYLKIIIICTWMH